MFRLSSSAESRVLSLPAFNHVVSASHGHYSGSIITLKVAGDERATFIVHRGIAERCPYISNVLKFNEDKTTVEYTPEAIPFHSSALFFLVDFMYCGKFKPAQSVHDFLKQNQAPLENASSPAPPSPAAQPAAPPLDATGKHVDSPGCRCLLCHNNRADGTSMRQVLACPITSAGISNSNTDSSNNTNNSNSTSTSTSTADLPKLAEQDMQTWEMLLDVHIEAFLCGEYHSYTPFCTAVAVSLIGMFEMAGEYAARIGVLRRCIYLFDRLARPDHELLVPVIVRVAHLLPHIRQTDAAAAAAVAELLDKSPGFVTLALMQTVSRGSERKQLPRMT